MGVQRECAHEGDVLRGKERRTICITTAATACPKQLPVPRCARSTPHNRDVTVANWTRRAGSSCCQGQAARVRVPCVPLCAF